MVSKVSPNLIKHWQELCNVIVFTDIAPLLIQNKIITLSDYENIKSQPQRAETESLLFMLLKKEESVLLKFVETLERDYRWLAEKLRGGDVLEQGRDETDAVPITQMDSREQFDDEASAEEERNMRMGDNEMSTIRRNYCLNNEVYNRGGQREGRKVIKMRVNNILNGEVPSSDVFISSSTDLVKKEKNEENRIIMSAELKLLIKKRDRKFRCIKAVYDQAQDLSTEKKIRSFRLLLKKLPQHVEDIQQLVETINRIQLSYQKSEPDLDILDEVDEIVHQISLAADELEEEIKAPPPPSLKPKVDKSKHVPTVPLPIFNEITEEIISKLRRCSLVAKRWTTIANSLGLTDSVPDIRFKVCVYNEPLSMCIVHLIREWVKMFPKEATLSKLIEVLRSENFNIIADELSEKNIENQ